MATIAARRTEIATALSAVGSLVVKPRPVTGNLKAKDGWVAVGKISPYDYSSSLAEFTAVIVLGSDPVLAETSMEALAIPLIDAITALVVTNVSIEPQQLVAGDGTTGSIYILALTFSMEVTV